MSRVQRFIWCLCCSCIVSFGAQKAFAVPVVNSVTLNGGSSVTVAPGASIAVAVTGTSPSNSANDRWHSTHHLVSGQTGVCVNTANVQNQANIVRSFNVTAPAMAGTYSITITLYSDDACANDASTPLTLTDSITVCPDDDSDGVCNADDACADTPGGETVNADGCSCSQLNCDDGDLCTTDSCVDGECVFTPIDCDDGDPCTTDSCLDGVCSNVFEDEDNDGVCDANDTCADTPGGETVNADGCSCSQLPPCDDGDPCTEDSCLDGECVFTPISCDDGDPCTEDSCLGGVCSNVFQDADGDLVCDANDICADTPGGETVNADGCSCSQLPPCDDGDLCTTDSCVDGECVFTPISCDDGDPCTADSCLDGVCSNVFQDADNDSVCDTDDGCPNDPAKIVPGVCGCGTADTDSDGDGTPNCNDGCPSDPNKVAPGVCGCGTSDVDIDGDGTADCNDGCPTDAAKTAPGQCGCGVADTDSDGDGVADCNDDDEPAPQPTPDVCGVINCAPGTVGMLPMLLAGMGLMRRRRVTRR